MTNSTPDHPTAAELEAMKEHLRKKESWIHGVDHAELCVKQLPRCLALIDSQAVELKTLRRILCHVPGRIAIAAKEDAGYPNHVFTTGVPE